MKLFRYAIIGLFLFLGGTFVGSNVSAQQIDANKSCSQIQRDNPSFASSDWSSQTEAQLASTYARESLRKDVAIGGFETASHRQKTVDEHAWNMCLAAQALSSKGRNIGDIDPYLSSLQNGADVQAVLVSVGWVDTVEPEAGAIEQEIEDSINELSPTSTDSLDILQKKRDDLGDLRFAVSELQYQPDVDINVQVLLSKIEALETDLEAHINVFVIHEQELERLKPVTGDDASTIDGKIYEVDSLLSSLDMYTTIDVSKIKLEAEQVKRELLVAHPVRKYEQDVQPFKPASGDGIDALQQKIYSVDTLLFELDAFGNQGTDVAYSKNIVQGVRDELEASLAALESGQVSPQVGVQPSPQTGAQQPPQVAVQQPPVKSFFPPGYEPNRADSIGQPVFDGDGLTRGSTWVKLATSERISKEQSLPKLISAWLRFGLSILVVVAVIAIIYAGFVYVTGGGDDSRYTTARQIVIWVVVGLLVVLGAYALVNTIILGFLNGA